MKPMHRTTHSLATNRPSEICPVQYHPSDQNFSCCDALDKALHLLIQREELLLGDALNQCNQLLGESQQQADEIKEFFDEDE